jgi:stage V sporulation protein G
MKVTEVRVKLNLSSTDRLRGFCSITLDNAFAVRDIKIIDGPGGLFVAMPSRKLMDHCPRCRGKNHVKARYCNTCGSPLPAGREAALDDGRSKLHCDVAHPINAATRLAVQEAIIRAFHEEVARSKRPGYVPQKLDEDDDTVETAHLHERAP